MRWWFSETPAPFRSGRFRSVIAMAIDYGNAETAVRLAERLPDDRLVGEEALGLAMATRNPRILLPLFKQAAYDECWRAQHEAASKCKLAAIKCLHAACGGSSGWWSTSWVSHCSATSFYGWRPIWEWMAWKGLLPDPDTLIALTNDRRGDAQRAALWAA
ncbi:F-box domain-containing protein [Pandoravirus kuranda]|uniref:F-box domain-containing protein n=1 Tax=Pandoravirus kuranda TaxID=3019033 RepID=A0AA95EEM5_9VIRU|nr:F-box domain-containing protein [Pandoravirus kuranda]